MKKNIYLMYAISLLQGMVFYGPVATLYRQAQGVSIFQITVIESVSLLLCLLLEIPLGVAADKIGYKRTMILCCWLYFLSKLVFWQAADFMGFLLERVMLSVVMAGLSGVDVSILYLSCEEGKSQRVFGVYNGLLTAGLLIASLVFSVFVKDDYKLAGGLTAVSYALAALASLFLTEVRPKEARALSRSTFKAALTQVLKDRHLLLLLAAIAFLSETHQTLTVFLSQLQYVRCGLSSAAIGYLYAAVTVAGLTGMCSAIFTRQAGMRTAGNLLYAAAAVSCAVLAFTGSAALSVGSILTLRISNSLFQPLQMEQQNRHVHTDNRATALSINAMIIDSVGVGTNLAFGALAQSRLSAAFLFGTGLCAAGGLLFFRACRTKSS